MEIYTYIKIIFLETNEKKTLIKLATLLHHRLEKKGISTWLPDFSVPMESQVHTPIT